MGRTRTTHQLDGAGLMQYTILLCVLHVYIVLNIIEKSLLLE